ncbi:MAG: cyclic nucleotide-binding domain-containing protein [Candidatus Rokubacteria bacterium]|nr:cyclic nucleotide-binding domain-containing protein [Candidatus Rokubacteria bacterium]
MVIRFWGTRGSVPAPGRRTAFFGGNTNCVELRAEDGQVFIFDCGTGARPLGLDILSRGSTLPPIHILVTHTHWDHIQGFPFFVPAYVPGGRLRVYGARGLDRTLEGSLSGQMQHTYFPVQLENLRADIDFVELSEERFNVGPYRVITQFLNHTAPTMGYRVEAGDMKVVYCTDHEPFWWTPSRPGSPNRFEHPGERRHLEFVAGAELLIHDAQYSDEEYPAKRGWGHSTIEYVTDLAIRAGVKRLALFHHDPLHTDAWVRQQTERARRRARIQGSNVEVFAAAEGLEIALPEPISRDGRDRSRQATRLTPTGHILVAGSDPTAVKEVRAALEPDGYRLTATHTADPTTPAAKLRPDLIALVGPGSEAMLLDLAERIRAQKWGAQLPILLLTAAEGPGAAGRLVDGTTDVLSRPFNPAMLRARVRAWLSHAGRLVQSKPAPSPPRPSRGAILSGTSLLKGLPFNERAALLSGALTCRFRKGEVLFRQGDRAGGVYLLRSGRVQVSIQLPDGGTLEVAVAKAGDTVGELAALDGGPRTATARALEATVADYVPPEMFQSGLSGAPGAGMRLLRLMAGRLRETDHLVGELAGATHREETLRRGSRRQTR